MGQASRRGAARPARGRRRGAAGEFAAGDLGHMPHPAVRVAPPLLPRYKNLQAIQAPAHLLSWKALVAYLMLSVPSSSCSISRSYTCLVISRAKLSLHLSVSCGPRMVLTSTMLLCLSPTTRWGNKAIGLDAHNESFEMMHLPISQPTQTEPQKMLQAVSLAAIPEIF